MLRFMHPNCYAHAPANGYLHRVPVLTTRFRYAHAGRFSGKARLFGDRIELTGWLGEGHRCILLDDIASMTYHPLHDDANLTLHLMSGEVLRLNVNKAHRWRERYEQWIRYAVLPSAKLLSSVEEVVALAG